MCNIQFFNLTFSITAYPSLKTNLNLSNTHALASSHLSHLFFQFLFCYLTSNVPWPSQTFRISPFHIVKKKVGILRNVCLNLKNILTFIELKLRKYCFLLTYIALYPEYFIFLYLIWLYNIIHRLIAIIIKYF